MLPRSLRLVVLLLCALILIAQTDANKGSITGTVLDPKQAVIPNAKVRVKNINTGFQREYTTGAEGIFRAVLLDPGTYDVTVEAGGFATAQFTGVIVNVGSAVDLPVTMQLGTTVQTVEVGASMVNLDLPAPSTVVSTAAIRDLPINGRRFQDFATLTPTVQVDPERGQLSFLGQRGINSNVMVDGADYNNPFFGGIRGGERSNFIITVPQSAIQEFQAVAAGYTAEYGRSTGGVLNVITKSGANALHGDAFYQIRHKETGLQTPFKVQILETLQQFGGSAGGPLVRDKMFWFGAIERQRSRLPGQVLYGAISTLAPSANTQEAYAVYKSQEGPFSRSNDATALTARMDQQFLAGHRFTLRYNFSDATAQNAASVGGATETLTNNALSTNGDEKDRTHSGVAQFTSVLGSNKTNDARFSWTYELRPRTSNSAIPTVSNTIGTFGTRSFLPTVQDDTRVQISDGFAWIRGSHTFKFGLDYSYLNTFQLFGFNQFGSFTTNVGTAEQILEVLSTGGPTANRFDHINVTYDRQIGNLLAEFKMHQFAFFGQDSWRVNRSLSLDFGLRWEGQFNPSPDATNAAVINQLLGVRYPNGAMFDPTFIPDATDQWMPRFGFTFTPTDSKRTVIRGHAGIFYASTPMLLFADHTNNFRLPPGSLTIRLGGAGSGRTVYQAFQAVGVDLNRTSLTSLPILTPEQVAQAGTVGGQAPDPFRGAQFTGISNDFQNPRAFQFGFGGEHSFTNVWVAGVHLDYANTVHLQRNRDYNLPLPALRAADGRLVFNRANRPLTAFNQIRIRESSARQMYRGVTFKTDYRGGRFLGGFAYTLSDNHSDDDNERTATSFYYQNAYDLRSEYSYSRLDIRHQAQGYGLVRLPWDISLSGSIRMRSALPFDAGAGTDLNGDGNYNAPSVSVGASDRPYRAVGVSYERNAFRNLMFKDVSMRFLKGFRFGERYRLEFSTEMFNLFNWDNVIYAAANLVYGPGISAAGAVVPANANFMRLRLADGRYDTVNTQLGTPFQAQFGLRLFF